MNWRGSLRGVASAPLMRTLLAATAIGLAAVSIGALLMWSIIQLDHGQLRSAVREAFSDKSLLANSGQLFDPRRGDYLFNDCLILQTLLLGRDDWRHSVIDATIYLSDSPCENLEKEVTAAPPLLPAYQYSRYVFSARVAAAPLLAWLGVKRAKHVLRVAVYLTLLLTVLVGARGLASRSRTSSAPRTLYLTGIFCAIAMLGMYRLEYYAQTLAHGFSDWVIAAFLLYSLAMAGRGKIDGAPTAAVVLGVLTGCFELLTGPILIAVGMAVLLDLGAAPRRPHPYLRALHVAFACVAGMLLTLFWQQAVVSVFSDARPFYQFATHLAMRLQLHQFFAIPFDPNWATVENLRLYSPADVADAVLNALPQLTHGSLVASRVVFGASLLALVAGAALARPGCVIAAVVALSVPAWYLAFANHTVLHSLYMIRMAMLLPLCAGVSLMYFWARDDWMAERDRSNGTRGRGLAANCGREKAPRSRGVTRGRETPAAK